MRFNMDQAWRDALRAALANKDVLLTLAGVFVFLPGLLTSLYLSGTQAQLMEKLAQMQPGDRDPAAVAEIMRLYLQVAPFALLGLLAEAVGMMAMMALLTDRSRPTVGEALGRALRGLPVVVGAGIVFFLGYMLAALIGSGILALITALLHLAAGAVMGLAVMGLVAINLYVLTRLSLLLPVVVIEGERNPMAALRTSWRLTRGQAGRLLTFYLLLLVAYVVVALVTITVPLALMAMLFGRQGQAFLLASGVVEGVVGVIATVLFTAILAAIHRQLAGPSPEEMSGIFE